MRYSKNVNKFHITEVGVAGSLVVPNMMTAQLSRGYGEYGVIVKETSFVAYGCASAALRCWAIGMMCGPECTGWG